MSFDNHLSPLLALPRELREEILGYLTLPEHVYTSSSTPHTHNLHRTRKVEKTYVDTRIYLPYRFPPNVLASCRQLRRECLEHHAYLLSTSSPAVTTTSRDHPTSWILAERVNTENEEEAERACDDGTLRITIEVQRNLRSLMGYAIPVREELSTRFLALLSHMDKARKLKVIVLPGYEWWNGGPQPLTDKLGKLRTTTEQVSKHNPVSIAIGKILEHLSYVEELHVQVLMQASEAARWDLPDKKWENIQPWLDGPVAIQRRRVSKKVTRTLTAFWTLRQPETFYTQIEIRQSSGQSWKVERKGDMGTVSYFDAVVVSNRPLIFPAYYEVLLH